MKQKAKSLRRFALSIFLGANVMSILLLWVCCISTSVSPSAHAHFSVVGLAFPIILFFNLLFIPFWLIFKARFTLIPLLGILSCTGFILDYFPLNAAKESPDSCLTVISWNVKSFDRKFRLDDKDEPLAYIDSVNADIVCLQECYGGETVGQLNAQMSAKGFYHEEADGRQIYSRYPILSSEVIPVPSANKNGMSATQIRVGSDTIVVINAHLECDFISQDDRTKGKDAIKSGEADQLKEESRHLWGKLAVSYGTRGMQVDTLVKVLDTKFEDCPVIVCGDFNDTPISYAYQQMDKRLENAYRNCGFGVGVSYNERYFLFRIDHLFHSDFWKTFSAEIDHKIHASDHYPLVVKLGKR